MSERITADADRPAGRPGTPADDVDPDIRVFQQRTTAAYESLSGGAYRDLAHRRAVAEEVRKPWVEGGPVMASTEEMQVGDPAVRIRIHRPTNAPDLPALIYIHGGGWTLFSLDTHDRLMREYAQRTGCAVIGVDYSLAPEYRFPHALNEVVGLCRWVEASGARHSIDPDRAAIGGDSAGANLALAAALKLRDEGKPSLLRGLLLNYGVYDGSPSSSYRRYDGPQYMLTAEEMDAFWQTYLGDEDFSQNPYARPIIADPAGLPPAFFCVAQCDILLDENCAMAERLKAAGVPTEVRVYAGATHSFLEAVNISPLASAALAEEAGWLRKRLAS